MAVCVGVVSKLTFIEALRHTAHVWGKGWCHSSRRSSPSQSPVCGGRDGVISGVTTLRTLGHRRRYYFVTTVAVTDLAGGQPLPVVSTLRPPSAPHIGPSRVPPPRSPH